MGLLDSLIGNPDLKGPERLEATRALVQYVETFATKVGIKRLIAMTNVPKLQAYYAGFGYAPALKDTTVFVKGEI